MSAGWARGRPYRETTRRWVSLCAMVEPEPLAGKHVVFLSWRDTHNPEGGGAERYLEKMAAGLVDRGCEVTIFCAAHAAAPPDEDVDGDPLRPPRLQALGVRRRACGRCDAATSATRTSSSTCRTGCRSSPGWSPASPVVVLVHHVHREQWPVVYPGLAGRVGWWIERRLAPWLYRREPVRRGVARDPRRAARARGHRPARRRRPQRHRPALPVERREVRAPR